MGWCPLLARYVHDLYSVDVRDIGEYCLKKINQK